MTDRTAALHKWFRALVNSGLDLTATRAARASFEVVAGKQELGELCGDFVQEMPEEKPAKVPFYQVAAEVEREGYHMKRGHTPERAKAQRKPEAVAIGKRVQSARTQAHPGSMTRFAKLIGITSSSLSAIENGKSRPSETTLQKLSKILRVSADWLRTGQAAQ